ncbi:hypothetical protein LJC27_01330 [Christensenellaceae bacterium OttesenSCG-928-M15]|nr:hypothetical protein [Christensenellaceae bacterium OttesenSCG-928-M15]
MEQYTKEDLKEALRAVASMINKCEKAQEKLTNAPSQQTLLKNRLKALRIASALLTRELEG